MEKIQKDHIKEARRYVDNAKELLATKAGRDDKAKTYIDPKFVKMAGNTLWNGVLVALDGTFGVKNKLKKGQRADFTDYKSTIDRRDKSMGRVLLGAYETTHKAMGYDGNLLYEISKSGIRSSKDIIDWCEKISKI